MKNTSPYGWISQYLFGFFFSYGVYLPFWALWFSSQGVSATDIGTLVGLGFATRCASNLLITPRIHKLSYILPALRWLSFLGTVAASLYFVAGGNFWIMAIATVLFNLCMGPMMPLPDAMANYYAKLNILDYGSTRVWGSISFIVGSTLVGYLVTGWGSSWILYTAIFGFAATWMMSLRTPDPKPLDTEPANAAERPKLLHLLREWPVVKFLVLVALIQGSHAAYYSVSSLYWKQSGYSEDVIGYLWSLGVVAEVMLFALSKRIFAGWGVRTLFLISSVAVIVRWGITASTTALIPLVIVQLLHSLTYALAHLAAIRYIQQSAQSRMVALQSLYNALAQGLCIAIMTSFSGWGFQHFGANVFWVMSAMGFLSLLVRLELPRSQIQASS
ncbi:3-phenylpropionate MFS transporter [Vibrio sp. CAIM 722]|uniref:3-phenylpropionate MFS transporter n=1 Tax=Vibrio eleionomae TaxID=2653505 RepID=A0A7X4LM69_9VIBR|nr:3-phenylpropionate MFS transporter [Vibrio eleionomae]MZI94212.1 3-phenylpropionate MFS transporter [Vibrio eleionomae]